MKFIFITSLIGCIFGSFMLGMFIGGNIQYNKGYEEGKQYIPTSMSNADSSLVIYYNDRPIVTNSLKMPKDSIQICIDNVLGVPKHKLILTIKQQR